MVDYHTAQGPDEVLLRAGAKTAKSAGRRWHRPATRREELDFSARELATVLSSRQYRVDALWTCAVWADPEVTLLRWQLSEIVTALKTPHFVPYLGRKSCPLDVPMEPQLIEALDPVAAIAQAAFHTDELLQPLLERSPDGATVHWEGSWPGLVPAQTVRRRDKVLSRARWQFSEREEHQMSWIQTKGGHDVPEQS